MSFEENVAFHCAPTLAGLKPSNLFTWRHMKKQDTREHTANLTDKLAGSCLKVDILCECERYSLIFIYRESMLKAVLRQPEVRIFLSGFGYPPGGSLGSRLEKLKSRVTPGGAFPHEIGLFLGYPLGDVAGFINWPDKRCALRGEWKVYGNEFEAAQIFERFRNCRDELYQKFMSCGDIANLVA